jgi:RNA polymerase sigma-70 factor (ECF subfamily)
MALDEAALLACYRRLEKPLHNVLYRWLWDAHECQDVMHDAYLKVRARRDEVRADGLEALVYATALNVARNRLRWRALWRREPLDAEAPAPGEDPVRCAQRRAEQRRLRAALATLSAAQRDVLLLSELAGLSTREIARVLAIPEGTVGSRKFQALARLRERLGSIDD